LAPWLRRFEYAVVLPVGAQLAVLRRHPASGPGPHQVRRVECHQGERIVGERQRAEVHARVGVDVNDPAPVFAVGPVGDGYGLVAHIAEQAALIARIEPHHASTATGV